VVALRIGVLALQGDFAAHVTALRGRGAEAVEVRRPAELAGLSGVVLPGGESTTMLKLMNGSGLFEALSQTLRSGVPALATCAGAILLAREVRNPAQRSLGVLDAVVERNAYGRQIDSTVVPLTVEPTAALAGRTVEGVFIRAPRFVDLGPGVEVLARRGADPVLVRERRILAATFHPELSGGSPVVELFLRLAGGAS
jgi:pyridoxal 5'-phosphate synthase pdxT subunit